MAEFKLNNIDKNFFWELIEEGYGEYRGIEKAYLDMLAEKLSDETEIRFRVDRGVLYNESIDFTIPTSEITTYDNLLKRIEKHLNDTSVENEYGVDTNKLASEWGYSYSSTSITPYYEGDGKWHAYDEYSQPRVFEVMYFGAFGEFHKDMAFCNELGKKYLIQDNWNEKKHYKGEISELNGLFVTFAKNGNISVKTKDKEFWDKVDFFYSVTDPKNKNHAR